MARRRDTETITMPGMEKLAPPVKGKLVEITVASGYGNENFGSYEAKDNYNLPPVPDIPLTISTAVIIEAPVLRNYQERAKKALLWAISAKNPERVSAAAGVMATGTGKTTLGCAIAFDVAKRFGRRVMIVCNQDELITQWIEGLDRIGITGLREQAENDAASQFGAVDEIVVVGSQQTLKRTRLQRWPRDFFDLIIHDECDLALCPTWEAIIDWFAGARHLGLTATPDRLDGSNITRRFPCIPKDAVYSVSDAIKEGWLVRPVEKIAKHEEIDLTKLRIVAGDFADRDVEKAIVDCIGALAETSAALMEGRPTIAFTPTVFSAELLAEAYRQLGLTAVAISGKTGDKKIVFEQFREGKIDVLVNCNLVTRGVDLPIAENVVMARPTLSRALWVQMIGRIMRPYTDEETLYTKKVCRIINFAWKFQKKAHKLMHAVDLFDTPEANEDVMSRAKELYDRKKEEKPDSEIDIEETIKEAEVLLKREIAERIQIEIRGRRASVTTLDPLALEILDVPQNPRYNWMGKKAITNGQIDYLRSFKIDISKIPDLTMNKASRMIDELKKRREVGMASWPQVKTLINCGVEFEEARKYSFEEASAYLDVNLPLQPWYKAASRD